MKYYKVIIEFWQAANYLTVQHLYHREILLSIDKEDKSLIVEGKGDCFVIPLRGTPSKHSTTKFDCGWTMGLLRRFTPRNDSTIKFGYFMTRTNVT